MFEDVVGESAGVMAATCPPTSLTIFDGALERLLADPDADLDRVRDYLPPEWDDAAPDEPVLAYGRCEPSGWLALDLDSATADPGRLPDDTLIEAMVGFDRLASWAAARQARLLAELARRRPSNGAVFGAVGGGGQRVRPRRGRRRAAPGLRPDGMASRCWHLPETHAEESGRKRRPTRPSPETVQSWPETARVEAQNCRLGKAFERLEKDLGACVIAADPVGVERRDRREARRDRRVVITPEADGMASLWALLTATQAAGAFTWLTRLARGLGADDPRSMDTRRADILAALLSGQLVVNPDTNATDTNRPTLLPDRQRRHGTTRPATDGDESLSDTAAHGPGRPIHPVTPGKPLIQIVIPYSTLIGADDQPAELVGVGPIPASLAREAAADGVGAA